MTINVFKKLLRKLHGNDDNTIFVELPDKITSIPVQGIEMKASGEGNMYVYIITTRESVVVPI
jgi:hypothetical protein